MTLQRKTKQVAQEIGQSLVPLFAEGMARAAELAADGTRKTADAARDWADDVQGVTARRRMYAGLGLVALIGALVIYLTSSNGRKTMRKLPGPVQEVIKKAS